jgi:ribonuclease MRP protein subunit RMP1
MIMSNLTVRRGIVEFLDAFEKPKRWKETFQPKPTSSNSHIIKSTMAANEPASSAQQLQNLYRVVHLVYHRNKNQHRRSLWWRHLNSFRRDLRTLSAAAPPPPPDDEPAAPSRPTADGGGDPAAPAPAPARPPPLSLPPRLRPLLRRWARERVPRWHAAFGRVLAERRFVAVGLVLLAALAQAAELLGVRALMDDEARRRRRRTEVSEGIPAREAAGRGEGVDLGVVVERGAVEVEDVGEREGRKRAKRKKGNVIDDLFDELG